VKRLTAAGVWVNIPYHPTPYRYLIPAGNFRWPELKAMLEYSGPYSLRELEYVEPYNWGVVFQTRDGPIAALVMRDEFDHAPAIGRAEWTMSP
jgi:hypothetical protein